MDNNQVLSDLIDQLQQERKRKKELEFELNQCKARSSVIEGQIMSQMDDAGITKSGNKVGSITLTEEVVPQVTDWDAFWDHVFENRETFWLQKRAAVQPCREAFSMGRTIPGVLPFVKRKLTFKEQ